MSKTIVILEYIDKKRYKLPRYFQDCLIKGFKESGYQIVKLGNEEIFHKEPEETIPKDTCFIFSIYGILMFARDCIPFENYKKYIIEHKIRWYEYCLDHPYRFPVDNMKKILAGLEDNVVFLSVDKEQREVMKRMFQVKAFHFSLGGRCLEESEQIPFEEKEDGIVFTGNIIPMQADPGVLTINNRKHMQSIINYYLEHPDLTLREVLKNTKYKVINEMYITLETFIRNNYRMCIIDHLQEVGLPIHIYGSNWNKMGSNVYLHGHVSPEECIKAINRYKYAINVLPLAKYAHHDRVFDICGNGTLCFTDTNHELNKTFTDGKNIVFYDLKDLHSVVDRVKYYIEHPEEAKRIVSNSRKLVLNNWSWEQRAKQLIRLYEEGE